MRAEENVKAFHQAVQTRSGQDLTGCIFHSDRGSQYISHALKHLLREHKMRPSMCKIPQQNAYAEKVQDTIKNKYLVDTELEGKNLKAISSYIKRLYNEEKPHTSVKMLTPSNFEKYAENIPFKQRPKELIFKWDSNLSTKSELLTKRKK